MMRCDADILLLWRQLHIGGVVNFEAEKEEI
jgi:hypothetical protein